MQPIIEQLQSAMGGNVGLALGYLLIAALLLQVVFMLVSSVRGVFAENAQHRLERERLEVLLQTAKAKWAEQVQDKALWNGARKFTVARKVLECEDVYSFYLAPHDGKSLPAYKPGQYLTFQLDIPGQDKAVVRCYSLSDSPTHPDRYRVTIKKEKAPPDRPELPPGRASSFFCDVVKEGDILDVKAPTGHFYLDMTKPNPVVLISGGVGITPMLSMANAIAASGSKREVWFFFGARNRTEHILKEEIQRLAEAHDNIKVHVCYSRPSKEDVLGRDYQHASRVTVELMKQLLPSNNFEYYLCGNGAFMKTITDDLEAWGVPDKNVHFEAFGPATVKKKAAVPTAAETTFLSKVQVTFSRTNKSCLWDPTATNLLEFAQGQGVRIDSGCCAGSCGSCLVAVKSGEVEYLKDPDSPPETGSCLTCICKPKGNLVLDA